jgi:hypothetical protein
MAPQTNQSNYEDCIDAEHAVGCMAGDLGELEAREELVSLIRSYQHRSLNSLIRSLTKVLLLQHKLPTEVLMGTVIEALLRSNKYGMWFHCNIVSDAIDQHCSDDVLAFNASVDQDDADIGECLSTLVHKLHTYASAQVIWMTLSQAAILDNDEANDD